MRLLSLILFLLAAASCRVTPPSHGFRVSVNATVKAKVQVTPPAPLVPLQGAAVVEFFGIPLEGANGVVFVLDRSGSMKQPASEHIAELSSSTEPNMVPRKIDVAHAELVAAIEQLPAGTQMNVVFFNRQLEAFAASMVSLEDASREELIGFVTGTFPTGRTALAPAMRTAILMNANRVILLSDGLGNVGGDAETVLRDAREAMRGGLRIDTIGLGKDQDIELLRDLAVESGGLYQAL